MPEAEQGAESTGGGGGSGGSCASHAELIAVLVELARTVRTSGLAMASARRRETCRAWELRGRTGPNTCWLSRKARRWTAFGVEAHAVGREHGEAVVWWLGSGFRIQGLGFRVYGLGFTV